MHSRLQKLTFPRGGLSAAPGRLLQIKQAECETQRHQWHCCIGLCMRYQMLRGNLPSPNIAPANKGGRLDDAVMLSEEIEMKNNESAGAVSGEVRAIVSVCLNLVKLTNGKRLHLTPE